MTSSPKDLNPYLSSVSTCVCECMCVRSAYPDIEQLNKDLLVTETGA